MKTKTTIRIIYSEKQLEKFTEELEKDETVYAYDVERKNLKRRPEEGGTLEPLCFARVNIHYK